MTTRRTGVMRLGQRFGRSDHACWGYDSTRERALLAASWIADGLGQGQLAMYVADAPLDVLAAELAAVPGRDDAIGAGALVIAATRDTYDLSTPIDAQERLAFWGATLPQAIAAGFSGVRIAVDITSLVEDPARRPAHLHWEQYADRFIAQNPLAPLCLYDRRVVTDFDAVRHVHPLTGPQRTAFTVHAADADSVVIDGEADTFDAESLVQILANMPVANGMIGAEGLTFIDARTAYRVAETLQTRRAAGELLTLQNVTPLVRRVWTVCGLDEAYLSA